LKHKRMGSIQYGLPRRASAARNDAAPSTAQVIAKPLLDATK